MYVLQVRLLPDQPVSPTGNSDPHTLQRGHQYIYILCVVGTDFFLISQSVRQGNSDPDTLQRHLGHERPQTRPHAEADVQDDTFVLQLAGQ